MPGKIWHFVPYCQFRIFLSTEWPITVFGTLSKSGFRQNVCLPTPPLRTFVKDHYVEIIFWIKKKNLMNIQQKRFNHSFLLQNYQVWKNWLKITHLQTFSLMKLLFHKETFQQKCWLKFPKKCHQTTLCGLLAKVTSHHTKKIQFWMVIIFLKCALVNWSLVVITILTQTAKIQ